MDVASGLAAISGISASIDGVNKLLTALKDTTHHEQLVHLREALLTTKGETLALRENLIELRSRLSEAEAKAKLRSDFEFYGTFYWGGREKNFPANGPYCSRCLDVDKQPVRLHNDWSDYFTCPACKTGHRGPDATAQLRHRQSTPATIIPRRGH